MRMELTGEMNGRRVRALIICPGSQPAAMLVRLENWLDHLV